MIKKVWFDCIARKSITTLTIKAKKLKNTLCKILNPQFWLPQIKIQRSINLLLKTPHY